MQGNYDLITLEIPFCSLSREHGIPPAANVSESGLSHRIGTVKGEASLGKYKDV